MRRFLILLFVCLSFVDGAMGQKHTFEIKDGSFLLNGKPFAIHSGEMHYARVPKPYWSHRLKMMRAMGLNTVTTYVFWNFHETHPGVWDFKSDNHNLREFILMAQQEGLHVILRPGPYACAEWEFGGFPWWLLKNKDLEIRTEGAFVDSCRTYVNRLAEEVVDLQITKGGAIIMVQVENEFGSYVEQQKNVDINKHQRYYRSVLQLIKDAGFDVPLFTSDGTWLFKNGAIKDVLPTANGEGNVEQLKKQVDLYHNGVGPYMVAEYYPGWLDHWAEPFVKISTAEVVSQIETYLKDDVSFNFYMIHGGTNFGFTSGANFTKEIPIQPQLTSYDYDAPISESGLATGKYLALRDLMQKYSPEKFPEIPAAFPVIQLKDISLTASQSLFEIIKHMEPVVAPEPLSFEDLNQGSGYVIYRKRFQQPVKGQLQINGLRDFAQIYVNGQFVGVLNRMENNFVLEVDIPFNGLLDIVVENMGRINYGDQLPFNHKGIIEPVYVNDAQISGGWQMFKMSFDEMPELSVDDSRCKALIPALYKGRFKLNKVGDTFLDMRVWGKGIVFVNGHHLGRFWSVGPQQTLYLPGCWLKKGYNEVVVLDLTNPQKQSVLKSLNAPILESLELPNKD